MSFFVPMNNVVYWMRLSRLKVLSAGLIVIKIINRYAALVNMSGHILLQSFWSVLEKKCWRCGLKSFLVPAYAGCAGNRAVEWLLLMWCDVHFIGLTSHTCCPSDRLFLNGGNSQHMYRRRKSNRLFVSVKLALLIFSFCFKFCFWSAFVAWLNMNWTNFRLLIAYFAS